MKRIQRGYDHHYTMPDGRDLTLRRHTVETWRGDALVDVEIVSFECIGEWTPREVIAAGKVVRDGDVVEWRAILRDLRREVRRQRWRDRWNRMRFWR